MTMTYTIGPGLEYEYFDQITKELSDGDVVNFTSGTHIVLESEINVSNLTITGENAINTIVNFNPDSKNSTVFNVTSNSEITISNITCTVSPTTTLFNFENNVKLNIDHSDISWNNYNIKHLLDNKPVFTIDSENVKLTSLSIVETTLPSIDLVAESIILNSTVIGDANGSVGRLSGWVEDSNSVSFNTMELGLVGEIKNIEILGATSVENVSPQLLTDLPNLNSAPLILDGIVYSQKMAIVKPSKDQKRLLRYKKNYHRHFKFKSNPREFVRYNYYLMNNKTQGTLFIVSEPSDFPDDQPLIYNTGNLVMRGTETDVSNFKNVQASGQLLLTNYSTKLPWIFEDDGLEKSKVLISESTTGNVTGKNTKYALKTTQFAPNLDSNIPDIIKIRRKYLNLDGTPVLDLLNLNMDNFENVFPTIFIKGVLDIDEIHSQLKIFLNTLFNEKLSSSNFVMQISEETILKRNLRLREDVLIKRQQDVWFFPSWQLLETENGKNWLKLIHTMTERLVFYPKFAFYDTDTKLISDVYENSTKEFPNAILIDTIANTVKFRTE